jgi:hypothetical protein
MSVRNYTNNFHVDTRGNRLVIGKIYRLYGISNPHPTNHTSNDQWDQFLVDFGLNKLVKIIDIKPTHDTDLYEGLMEYVDGTKTPRWSSYYTQLELYKEGGKRSKKRKRRKSKKRL